MVFEKSVTQHSVIKLHVRHYIHFEFYFFYLLLTFMEVNSVDVINGRNPVRNGGHPIK